MTPPLSCVHVNLCPELDLQLATPPVDDTQVKVPPSFQPEQVLTPSTLGTQKTSNEFADTCGVRVTRNNPDKPCRQVDLRHCPRFDFMTCMAYILQIRFLF